MASSAPITAAPTGELNYELNGVNHFAHESAGQYIEAAHAVAYLGEMSAMAGRPEPLSAEAFNGTFYAIQLLLAHAHRITEEHA